MDIKNIMVLTDDQENPDVLLALEATEFVILTKLNGEFQLYQSIPEDPVQTETAIRVLAAALTQSNSPLSQLLGTIVSRAMEKGAEEFLKANPLPDQT